MTYDWQEIVKKKSLKEVASLVTGQIPLPKEATEAAKIEITNRGFCLDDSQRIIKQIELDILIEEQNFESGTLGKFLHSDSKSDFKMFRIAIVMTIFFIINMIFNLIKTHWGISLLFLLGALFITISSYFSYRKKVVWKNGDGKELLN